MAVIPSAASLILKALNEPPRDRKKVMLVLTRVDIEFVLVRILTLMHHRLRAEGLILIMS